MIRRILPSRFLFPLRPSLRLRLLLQTRSYSEGSSQLPPGTQAYLKRERVKENGDQTQVHEERHLDTILSHAGLASSSSSSSFHGKASLNEPLTPPLHLSTTFTRPPSGDYFDEEQGGQGYIYSRMNNPTRNLLEETISNLEIATRNGAARTTSISTTTTKAQDDSHEAKESRNFMSMATTCAFSSGMAAISSLLLALSSQTQSPLPLHVIVPTDVYHGVPTVLSSVLTNQVGISFSAVDMTSVQGIQTELERILNDTATTKCNVLVWMESPSNPLCQVVDIEKVSDYVKCVREEVLLNQSGGSFDIVTAVDSTWSPPTITKPLLVRL